ncbi:MAG: thymidine phosphorylase [Verrucomicrobiae bacterium]|nr:thymidine phosphorylase [Verrucomicrobiae bacterium]
MFLPARVIERKRDGQTLTEDEIRTFVLGFTCGEIPDYQMAALAMAIYFRGLNAEETFWLTRAMLDSGRLIQWPAGGAFYCDKHSTGGVGDKTSLVLAPLVACFGVRVPMVSGRGLGPTGGTLDKLESIRGFRTDLSAAELVRVTEKVGCCISGATAELAPADRKLYALRDVTATVPCPSLIVASIMSKKLAENVDGLVLDVKWGSGAFMRTQEAARALAEALVDVGKRFGKKTVALLTDMNQPLGRCVGNALEVREAMSVLAGDRTAADLVEVTVALAAEMLLMAGVAKDVAAAREMLQKKLVSGEALRKFQEMVAAQNGDLRQPLPQARWIEPVCSARSGVVQSIVCDQFGYALIVLGGGRLKAEEPIDHAVGFECLKKVGDGVEPGEPLVMMHHNDPVRGAEAAALVQRAYQIGGESQVQRPQLICGRIG